MVTILFILATALYFLTSSCNAINTDIGSSEHAEEDYYDEWI